MRQPAFKGVRDDKEPRECVVNKKAGEDDPHLQVILIITYATTLYGQHTIKIIFNIITKYRNSKKTKVK